MLSACGRGWHYLGQYLFLLPPASEESLPQFLFLARISRSSSISATSLSVSSPPAGHIRRGSFLMHSIQSQVWEIPTSYIRLTILVFSCLILWRWCIKKQNSNASIFISSERLLTDKLHCLCKQFIHYY